MTQYELHEEQANAQQHALLVEHLDQTDPGWRERLGYVEHDDGTWTIQIALSSSPDRATWRA